MSSCTERAGRRLWMNETTSNNVRFITLGTETLVGIGIVLALMFYCIGSFPASISNAGEMKLLVSVCALLAYAGAAIWVRFRTSSSVRIALAQRAIIGLFLGAVPLV